MGANKSVDMSGIIHTHKTRFEYWLLLEIVQRLCVSQLGEIGVPAVVDFDVSNVSVITFFIVQVAYSNIVFVAQFLYQLFGVDDDLKFVFATF